MSHDSTLEKLIEKKQPDIHRLPVEIIFAWIDVLKFMFSFDTTNCAFPILRDLGVMCRSKLVSGA